jgi:hypothetical protein
MFNFSPFRTFYQVLSHAATLPITVSLSDPIQRVDTVPLSRGTDDPTVRTNSSPSQRLPSFRAGLASLPFPFSLYKSPSIPQVSSSRNPSSSLYFSSSSIQFQFQLQITDRRWREEMDSSLRWRWRRQSSWWLQERK